MYKKFYDLKANPFNVNPDPRFLFMTHRAKQILACLLHAVRCRKGFVLVSGEVGTGKTILMNSLLNRLRQEQVATAYVFNPRLNASEFLRYMMADFGIQADTQDKGELLMRLNQWLLNRHRAGLTAAVVVDEAQDASKELLEEIRLLTNLETATEKLLQVVLCGQPELGFVLRQPEMRQVWQRIAIRCETKPLSSGEMREYVAHRLRVAGAKGAPVFSPDAIEAISIYSRGIQRIANMICENALICGFVEQERPIGSATIETVGRELELDLVSPFRAETRGHDENKGPAKRDALAAHD
jgi:general secretion pathway protein A